MRWKSTAAAPAVTPATDTVPEAAVAIRSSPLFSVIATITSPPLIDAGAGAVPKVSSVVPP